jgi:hypothetical protein
LEEQLATEIARAVMAPYAEELEPLAEATHQTVLERTLGLIPDPLAWSSPPDAAGALLLSGKILFTLAVKSPPGESPEVTLTSRSVEGPGGVIGLEVEPRAASPDGRSRGYPTKWTFKFPDGNTQEVRGFIATDPEERLDAAEEFARRLAGQMGHVVAPESH